MKRRERETKERRKEHRGEEGKTKEGRGGKKEKRGKAEIWDIGGRQEGTGGPRKY